MTRVRPLVALALIAFLLSPAPAAHAQPAFVSVKAFATKTGFRGVVAWQATAPVSATVLWGTSPEALQYHEAVPDEPDTAGMAILDGLPVGRPIYYQVADVVTGAHSPVLRLDATNAVSSFDGDAYTLNLLVTLDTPAAPDGVPADVGLRDIAAGMNVLAERIYDALDGHARLGTVLVTDTLFDHPVNLPHPTGALDSVCERVADVATGTLADMVFQTTMPVDSHTKVPAGHLPIEDPCHGVYFGRIGNANGGAWLDDLYLGWLAAHETMHYAFGADDRYDLAKVLPDCADPLYDISLMDNSGGYKNSAAGYLDGPWGGRPRWFSTELDRAEVATCPEGSPGAPSWEQVRRHYTRIPPSNVPEHIVDTAPRGNPDGGALEILILENTPLGTALSTYTPTDPDLPVDHKGRFEPSGSLELSFAPRPERATPATSPEGCAIEAIAPDGVLALDQPTEFCHSGPWGWASAYRNTDAVPSWPAAFTSAALSEPLVIGGSATIVVHNADLSRAVVGAGQAEVVVEALHGGRETVLSSTTIDVIDGSNEATIAIEPSVLDPGTRLRVRMRMAGQTASSARMLYGGQFESGITLTTGQLSPAEA